MNLIKRLFSPVDMLTGDSWRKIVVFMVPMLIGNIAQQLYSTVDSVIVGKYVGDNALAAVGSASPILNLLIVLYIGIGIGAGIVVSQYLGAHRRGELTKAVGSCIFITAFSVVIVAVMALLLGRPLLRLLSTPDSIIDWCYTYLLILTVGSAGMAYYNILCGVLRGLGDSVSALLYLLIACGLNVVLDLVFVICFRQGVAGVAYATAIAQAVSALLCVRKLMHMQDIFTFEVSAIRWDPQQFRHIVRLGLPSGATQAIMSMAMLVVQSLTNSFGESFIAANVIVMRVDGFIVLPALSFGTALTTFAGQNVGAGQYDRVSKGAKEGTLIAVVVSAAITGLALLFGPYLMGIFTKTKELVTLSNQLLRILALGYLGLTVTQCLAGVMRGAGDTITPMIVSMFTTICIRVPLAYLMVWMTKTAENPLGDSRCIFYSMTLTWLIGALLNFIVYRIGRWRGKAVA